MKTSVVIITFLLLFSPNNLLADSTKNHVLAEQLILAMEMDKRFEPIKDQMVKVSNAQIDSIGVPEGKKYTLKNLQKRTYDIIFSEFSWNAMKSDFINIYAETYSEKELKDILAFFKSPAGKAYVAKSTELNQRLLDMSQRHAQRIMPKITDAIQEYKKENGLQ